MQTLTSESVLTIENVLDTPFIDELRVWRNSPDIRCNMLDDSEISIDEHKKYIESLAHRDDRRVYIVEDRGEPLIVLNLTIDDRDELVNLGWHGINRKEITPLYSVYAFFTAYDWLFDARPGYCQKDVVLNDNRSVWSFIQECGFELGAPRLETLKSGRDVLVRDTFCTRDLWLGGSAKIRRMYERVLKKATSAQVGLTW